MKLYLQKDQECIISWQYSQITLVGVDPLRQGMCLLSYSTCCYFFVSLVKWKTCKCWLVLFISLIQNWKVTFFFPKLSSIKQMYFWVYWCGWQGDGALLWLLRSWARSSHWEHYTWVSCTSSAFHSTAKSLCCCCFSGLSLLFKSRASFALIAISLVLTACLTKENQPFINNETYYIGSQESHKIEVVATWLFNEKQ